MNLIYKCFILVGIGTVMSCALGDPSEPASIDLANFTIDGKATKIITTVWGDYEVYDPTQDAEVIAAFNYVYKRGVGYDKDKQSDPTIEADLKPYIDFFNHIENIQLHDLARAGCGNPTIDKCLSDQIKHIDLQNCPIIDWGQPVLNACESKNIEFITRNIEDIPLGHIDHVCIEPDINFTRLYKRPKNLAFEDSYIGLNREKSFASHFSRNCQVPPSTQRGK